MRGVSVLKGNPIVSALEQKTLPPGRQAVRTGKVA
jgi:hypothetical protein